MKHSQLCLLISAILIASPKELEWQSLVLALLGGVSILLETWNKE